MTPACLSLLVFGLVLFMFLCFLVLLVFFLGGGIVLNAFGPPFPSFFLVVFFLCSRKYSCLSALLEDFCLFGLGVLFLFSAQKPRDQLSLLLFQVYGLLSVHCFKHVCSKAFFQSFFFYLLFRSPFTTPPFFYNIAFPIELVAFSLFSYDSCFFCWSLACCVFVIDPFPNTSPFKNQCCFHFSFNLFCLAYFLVLLHNNFVWFNWRCATKLCFLNNLVFW